jgi:hypothetical protein
MPNTTKTADEPPQDATEFIKNYATERARLASLLQVAQSNNTEKERTEGLWFREWLLNGSGR